MKKPKIETRITGQTGVAIVVIGDPRRDLDHFGLVVEGENDSRAEITLNREQSVELATVLLQVTRQ